MKLLTMALTGLLVSLVTTAPVAAHHKPDHQGGPTKQGVSQAGPDSHDSGEKHSKPEKDENTFDVGEQTGLHLGQRLHDLSNDEAGALAKKLQDCTDVGKFPEMRLGQIMRLAHAAGVSTATLKDLVAGDDSRVTGLGRLWNQDLPSEQADDLEAALDEGLEAEDLQQLAVGKVLQAAHACGLSSSELVELLDEH